MDCTEEQVCGLELFMKVWKFCEDDNRYILYSYVLLQTTAKKGSGVASQTLACMGRHSSIRPLCLPIPLHCFETGVSAATEGHMPPNALVGSHLDPMHVCLSVVAQPPCKLIPIGVTQHHCILRGKVSCDLEYAGSKEGLLQVPNCRHCPAV